MGFRPPSNLALAGVLLALPALAPLSTAQVVVRRVALTGDQAPGTPAGAFFDQFGTFTGVGEDFPPRLDAAGNCAFHAVLAGTGVTGVNIFDGNAFGVWKQVAGVTSLVARQDEPAPGTAEGVEFRAFSAGLVPDPPGIAAGRAGFAGALRGPGVDDSFSTNVNGLWVETGGGLALAFRNGDPAPGLAAGHTLRAFSLPLVTPAGYIFNGIFARPGDSPGSLNGDQEGFWSDRSGTLQALALGGTQAPGVAPGVVFGQGHFTAIEGAFRSWGSNESLALAFHGNLKGPGIGELNDEGIWIEGGGALALLVREGDPAPAVGPEVRFGMNSGIDTFGDVNPVAMNASGAILFGARHRGGSIPFTRGLWTTRSGALELIAHGTQPVTGSAPGSPAPGMGPGATFSVIALAQLNDADQVAFVGFATIDMDFDNQPGGVWWDRPGTLALVAREGDPAPGLPGIELAAFTRSLSFSTAGHLAFLADLRDQATGEGRGTAQILTDPEGVLHVVVRTGAPLDVAGDGSDVRVVDSFRPGVVNAAGELPLEIGFVDGSSGIFVARLATPVAVAPGAGPDAIVTLATPKPNPRAGAGPLTLTFTLDRASFVRFSLHDVSGREVAARAAEFVPAAGRHSLRWNPGRVPPGLYFVRLETDARASVASRCVVLE